MLTWARAQACAHTRLLTTPTHPSYSRVTKPTARGHPQEATEDPESGRCQPQWKGGGSTKARNPKSTRGPSPLCPLPTSELSALATPDVPRGQQAWQGGMAICPVLVEKQLVKKLTRQKVRWPGRQALESLRPRLEPCLLTPAGRPGRVVRPGLVSHRHLPHGVNHVP